MMHNINDLNTDLIAISAGYNPFADVKFLKSEFSTLCNQTVSSNQTYRKKTTYLSL